MERIAIGAVAVLEWVEKMRNRLNASVTPSSRLFGYVVVLFSLVGCVPAARHWLTGEVELVVRSDQGQAVSDASVKILSNDGSENAPASLDARSATDGRLRLPLGADVRELVVEVVAPQWDPPLLPARVRIERGLWERLAGVERSVELVLTTVKAESAAAPEPASHTALENPVGDDAEHAAGSWPTPFPEEDLPDDAPAESHESTPAMDFTRFYAGRIAPVRVPLRLPDAEEGALEGASRLASALESPISPTAAEDASTQRKATLPDPTPSPLAAETVSAAGASSASPSFPPAVSLAVLLPDGTAAAGAQIFSIRQGSRVLQFIGNSDASGRLDWNWPRALWGDSLVVRHACCESLSQPLFGERQSERIPQLRLKARGALAAQDWLVVTEAFGTRRGVEKAELRSSEGRTLEVSNFSGLLAERAGNSAGPRRIRIAGALPPEREAPDGGGTVVVESAQPPRAYIGLAEVPPTADKPDWRAFRRDLLARFVSATTFRPIVPSETKRMFGLVGLGLDAVFARGWEFTPLAGEFDYLLRMGASADAFSAALIGKQGVPLWSGEAPRGGEASPHAAARQLLEEALSALPVQGVLGEAMRKGAAFETNLTARNAPLLRAGQWFAVHVDGKAVGGGVLEIPTDGRATLAWKHGDAQAARAGSRLVRVSGEGALKISVSTEAQAKAGQNKNL